ncbi:hypothetical protein BDV12DRAFT_175298 [Aspergillus spectabilis]
MQTQQIEPQIHSQFVKQRYLTKVGGDIRKGGVFLVPRQDHVIAPHTSKLSSPPTLRESSSPPFCISTTTKMSTDDINLPPSYTSTSPRPFNLPRTLEPTAYLKRDLIYRPDFITLYFGFLGPTNWLNRYKTNLFHTLERQSLDVNRPLTQAELDFNVERAGRAAYQSRVGLPAGAVLGTIAAVRDARRNGFFHALAPQKTGIPTAGALFEGLKNMYKLDRAAFQSYAGKFVFRVIGWTLTGWILSGFWTAGSATSSLLSDPRMKDFVQEILKHDKAAAQKRRTQAVMAKNREAELAQQDAGMESGFPTGYGGYDRPISRPMPDPYASKPYDTPENNQPQDTDKSASFFDDDASPVAPEYKGPSQSQSQYQSQGSVWDRIRLQNQSQDPSQPSSSSNSTWNRLDNSNTGTSSGAQQDRDRAQEEFNRLLDAERKQGSDSESGGRKPGSVWST